MKETRKFISNLSAEWQKKISLQVCGALWPFSDSEEGDREFITTNLPNVKNLESKFRVLDTPKDDSDLPEYAADGGYVASIAAKLNPGQLVLAIAEQVAELGGTIVTSCKVEKVEKQESGELIVDCNFKEQTFQLKATSVVHCWNGYGAKDKFLPERLSKQIENNRI